MSGFVMGLVKLRAIERSSKMILMCMADNGNDQGENIYRSMEYLSREACCHKRTVQKKIGQMVTIGLLVDVGSKTYGRGHLRSFRLDLDALLTLFPDCHKVKQDVDPADLAGLIVEAEEEARAAGWLPPEEREECEEPGEKGGAAPPFNGDEKGGAGDQKGGAENTKGWPQRPPEPLRTVIEPDPRDAGARGGDPEGPPHAPGEGTLAAAWRALLPSIEAALGREKSWIVEATFRDAFVDERHEGESWQDASPDGKIKFGDPVAVTLLKLAVPDGVLATRINLTWRREIVRATGHLLVAAADPRAFAAREARLEREKAAKEAARQDARTAKRRAARS